MDLERAIETQRLRLLRIVAGLLVAVGVLTIGPVSCRFSDWVLDFVRSILSRVETAARYLVIAQARLMGARGGLDSDQSQLLDSLASVFVAEETGDSLPGCRKRLKALLAVLTHLPRHAARLIRRIERQTRGAARACRLSHCFEKRLLASLGDGRLAETRIERPPDKGLPHGPSFNLPPESGREALAVGVLAQHAHA